MQDIIDVKKSEKTVDSKQKSRSKLKFGKNALPWLLLILVLTAGLLGTNYYKNRAEKVESDPSIAQKEKNQAETDRVLAALKNVLFISETDAPTVARVEDPEKLKASNEAFYKDTQKGDYLIIFPKRAIVFRESNTQIINVAPIINTADLEKKQAEQAEQPAAETKTKTTR